MPSTAGSAQTSDSDPVFQRRCRESGIDPEKDVVAASTKWIDSVWHGRAWSWEKIPWLIEQWKKISGGDRSSSKAFSLSVMLKNGHCLAKKRAVRP